MSSSNPRPHPFPPGTLLSEHYTVEGLVRLAEGRMFYLANDDRPDRARRFCWDCGNDDTPRSAERCVACGASMDTRTFLVSVRWERDGFQAYADYFEKGIDHPGFAAPVDMFFQDDVLCSVTLWHGEGLLLDEASPLPVQQVLDMGQRATGILAYLHHHGVTLRNLAPTNFLIQDGERVVLYDPDIREVYTERAPEHERASDVQLLGKLLQRFVPVECTDLRAVLAQCADGGFDTPFAFGRALEELIRANLVEPSPIAAGMTDVGLARTLNEDNWGWTRLSDNMDLYVVADGMGGHDSGEVASMMAVATICSEAKAAINGDPSVPHERVEEIFDASFQAGNNGIKAHSEQLGNDMGTTMVASLVIDRKYAFVANVGDSRGYLVRGEMLHQITRDHSLVAKMVEQGRITEEEARVHPHSNILLRTVGTDYDVDIDIFNLELEAGDRILLCSDGLWGEVEDAEIEAIMNHFPDDHRSACRELVRAAHHGGGKDNVTVLIVGIPE